MEEIAAIRGQLHHGIYIDENTENLNSVLLAISLGVCDGFGLKVTRLGGLGNIATVRDLCESRSMPHTCDDTWGGDIIAAACVHIGATVHRVCSRAYGWLNPTWMSTTTRAVRYESKGVTSSYRPAGLGIVPDEGVFGEPVASFG